MSLCEYSSLTNRSQFVTVNDVDSERAPVTSGVPQGSVLGPLLFLIYINDLPTNLCSSVGLFADVCVIYREIKNDFDVSLLQSDINHISKWCKLWCIQLFTDKCKCVHVTRLNTTRPVYCLDDISLEPVSSYKYLGAYITCIYLVLENSH